MRSRPVLALVLFTGLAVVHTWPLMRAPWRLSLNGNADAEVAEWTISWIAHTLPRNPSHLFDGDIFAPERGTLAYNEPMVTPALMGAPIRWLGGSPVLTFNVVLVAGLVLTAWSAWFVAWKWTGSAGAALITGTLAAFNVHLLTRLPHLMAAHAWGLPLAFYFTDRLVTAPTRRDAAWLALVIAAIAANSIYWLALAGIIVAATAFSKGVRWRSIGAVAGAGAAGLVLAAPVLLPYVRFAAAGGTRPLSSVAEFSATPLGYLVTPSPLHAWWSARLFDHNDVNVLFAGVTALALAAIGVAASATRTNPNRRRAVLLVVVAATGFLLSLGPATAVYRWLYAWWPPLHGVRAAARFGFLVLLAVALAAGFGAAWLERRLKSPRLRAALVAAALVLVTAEAWQGPVRTTPFAGVPRIYTLLEDQPAPVLLVEVPFYPADAVFENGDYVLAATAHWQPLMNGYSGFTPASYRRRAAAFWFFPDDWAIRAIVGEGATHVMVHLDRFGADAPKVAAALAHRSDLRLVAADGGGRRLYAVVR
jgi:hypothetical protein